MMRKNYKVVKTGRLVKGYYNNPEEVKQWFGPAGVSQSGEKNWILNIPKVKPGRFAGGLYVGRERMRRMTPWTKQLEK